MALAFPSSPTVNQTYTSGTRTWTWNGTAWKLPSTALTGVTGTGNAVLSASPTFTGTVSAATITTSENITSNGAMGVGTSSLIGSTTSPLQITGDLAFIGSNRSILGNLYYSSGWKYAANGYGWGFREDGAGKLQIASAPNNTSGAGAAATVTLGLCSFDLTTRAVNIPGDITLAAYTKTIVALGTVTTTATIAITAGTIVTATLTQNLSCLFTMPSAVAGKSFILLLKQAASVSIGPGSASFQNVKWGTAGAPTISVAAGKMDILSFVSDGTNWYGSISQGYTY